MKVVLDSNVIVSGFLNGNGPSAKILDAVRQGRITWVLSERILEEVESVLTLPRIQRKYRVDPGSARLLVVLLSEDVVCIRGVLRLTGKSRDPKDDQILACAVEGQAEYLVTGDEDLLTLEIYERIPIMTPRRFLPFLGATG